MDGGVSDFGAEIIEAMNDAGTTDNLLSGILDQTTATGKFTQEFRLVSPESDSFEWLSGAHHTDEDSLIHQRVIAVESGTDNPVAGVPTEAGLALDSAYEDLALFGNATSHVTDRFDPSFGGRSSDNDQDAAQNAQIVLPILPGGQLELDFDDLKSSESPFTRSFSPRFAA